LNNFVKNEAVTIALLFSGLFLFLGSAAPSLLHSTLFVLGLAVAAGAILLMGTDRL